MTAAEGSATRLAFIDGVRGFAAGVVMLCHLIFLVPTVTRPSLGQASAADLVVWPFRFGTEMVYLFLLISGFSLYYSEASRRRRGGRSTYREFAARRAWRIGPVYYVALGLGTVATLIFSDRLTLRPENSVSNHLTTSGLVSHLFLVHNLNSDWLYQINGPLWSIAYEAQLYLLFPLIFIAMRRWHPVVVAVLVVGAVKAISLTHPGFPIFGLARWFVAGALLAELAARGVRVRARYAVPVGLAALGLGLADLPSMRSELRHDAIWLLAFVALLFAALEHPFTRGNPASWRWMRWLGIRSYSLYALHFPITLAVLYVAQRAGLHRWQAVGVTVGVGVPAALLVTVVAFQFVERPSLARVALVSSSRRTAAAAAG